MNRNLTREQIENTIKILRQEIPDVALRTSVITGFPGEIEDEFEELLNFVKEGRFDRLGVFRYSREEGTPAYSMKGQVSEVVKKSRFRRLMKAQAKVSMKKNRFLVGRTLKVLVEGLSDETEFLLTGRSMQQAPDNIDGITYINQGTASPGDIVQVTVTVAGEYDLVGEIAGYTPSAFRETAAS